MMDITITIGWWLVPTVGTLSAFLCARFWSPQPRAGLAGSAGAFISLLLYCVAAILSLILWLVWAVLT